MAKISYYLDTRSMGPEDECPIKIRVHARGSTSYLSTGLRTRADRWDAPSGTVGGPGAAALNARLARYSAKVDEALFSARMAGRLGSMTSKQIADMIRGMFGEEPSRDRKPRKDLFLPCLAAYRDRQTNAGTWEVYDRTVKALRAFDPGADTRTFADIGRGYLESFEADCLRGGRMKQNSVAILLRNIRAVFNWAIDEDLTSLYPFRKFVIRTEETRKRSLTVGQLRELFASEVTWQREYLDMFKLMFLLIGINAVDLFSAPPSAVENGRLNYRRAKTGKWYSVKIEPEAAEIMERYRGRGHLLSPLDSYGQLDDYLHRLNDGLKSVGRVEGPRGKVLEDGPWKALTTYWARHSWASVAYSLGIPVDVIGQALGHSDRRHDVTMIYIRQDAALVDEANRRVIDAVFGKKKSRRIRSSGG